MTRQIALTVVMLAILSAPAQSRTVPGLDGRYVYSGIEICPSGSGTLHQVNGTIAFDPLAGTAKLDFYAVVGDMPTMIRVRTSEAYSNTTSTLTLGPDTYKIAYGPVENGIATHASFIGLVKDGATTCGFQGSITLQ